MAVSDSSSVGFMALIAGSPFGDLAQINITQNLASAGWPG
jgi:hypothetical protein